MAEKTKGRILPLAGLDERPQPQDMPRKEKRSLKELFKRIQALPEDKQDLVWEKVADLSRPAPKPLPPRAPKLWEEAKAEAEGPYSPLDHLRKYYAPWTDGISMSRAEYRRLDPTGEQSLTNWLRNNTLPPDIDVPAHSVVLARREPASAQAKIREGRRLYQQQRRNQ